MAKKSDKFRDLAKRKPSLLTLQSLLNEKSVFSSVCTKQKLIYLYLTCFFEFCCHMTGDEKCQKSKINFICLFVTSLLKF